MARILVVDDSKVMRRNLLNILTDAGHEVVGEAMNGGQGFQMYQTHLPDIVTMDITMPDVDGVQGVKLIKKSFPDANIIMISALDQKQMVFEAIKSGAKYYIIKPVNPEKLIHTINEVLTAKHSETPAATPQKEEKPAAITPNAVGKPLPLEHTHAFSIELADNTFNLKLSKDFCDESCKTLNHIMQSLLYVHPLKVVIDFGTIIDFDFLLLDKLARIAKMIKLGKGSVNVTSHNRDFVQEIKKKEIEGISEVIKHIPSQMDLDCENVDL